MAGGNTMLFIHYFPHDSDDCLQRDVLSPGVSLTDVYFSYLKIVSMQIQLVVLNIPIPLVVLEDLQLQYVSVLGRHRYRVMLEVCQHPQIASHEWTVWTS